MLRFLLLVLSFSLAADEIPLCYQLMDQEMFQSRVVGNTIIGLTRQSNSLYMLHFSPQEECKLWKQNQIYSGKWWIEKDDQGRDVVRAFWPHYTSSEPASLFSPQNPRYGTATSLRYYLHAQTGAVLIAGKTFQASVILAPGLSF
ncbi:MAG: hypothetical protein LLG04_03665 [Parachlamydia sp.]|nr:hypothetical protein [Parachlamydia sp.]